MKKLCTEALLHINGGDKSIYKKYVMVNYACIADLIKGIRDGWNGK